MGAPSDSIDRFPRLVPLLPSCLAALLPCCPPCCLPALLPCCPPCCLPALLPCCPPCCLPALLPCSLGPKQ
ncbi:MAG: hypothetical protein FJ149_06055 [Euryarchaeota archaeon]|nr:hypothetical protein [Euryarchaeota archaeon]